MTLLPESVRGTAFEFFMLSKMVGGTAAAYIMVGQAIMDYTYKIAGGNAETMKMIGALEMVLGAIMAIGGIALPVGTLLAGILTANPALIALGAVGVIAGFPIAKAGMGMMALGAATYAAADKGYNPAESFGTEASYNSYLDQVQGGDFESQYAAAAQGTINEGLSLNIQNANFRTDNLNEVMNGAGFAT
jgi:hypothetical protein